MILAYQHSHIKLYFPMNSTLVEDIGYFGSKKYKNRAKGQKII